MKLASGMTLVLGASSNPERYSHQAVVILSKSGYSVCALGVSIGKIHDIYIYSRWEDLPRVPIDTITVYLSAERQVQYYTYILYARPRRVIFNPGAENESFEQQLRTAGIETLQACTLVMLRTNQY